MLIVCSKGTHPWSKRLFLALLILIGALLLSKHFFSTPRCTIAGNVFTIPAPQITLLFVGDLMQHQAQIDVAKRSDNSYDYSASFQFIKQEIKKADLAIGNLEVTLGGKPYRGYPTFSAPDEFLYAIHEAGFDILTTANNHCLDRGSRGGKRTIKMLDSLGIYHLGTYCDTVSHDTRHPLIINVKGFKLAFIAYTYATNGIKASAPFFVNYLDKKQIEQDIHEAKAHQPDAIIALPHWGNEYQTIPSKAQRELSEWLLDNGVTHIIGSHPHVVQPLELLTDSITGDKKTVAYSLGNFISNMSAPHTDGGIIVKLTLEKEKGKSSLKDYSYSFVWTLRPAFNSHKDFYVLPPTRIDSLQPNAQARFKQYISNTRSLFKKYNKEVFEDSTPRLQ